MDDKRLGRALTWAGSGGAVLAAGALALSGLYASTPDTTHPAPPSRMLDATAAAAPAARLPVASHRAAHSGSAPASTSTSTSTARAAAAANTWADPLPVLRLGSPVVAMASAGGSLVMAAADGGVFPIGRAGFYGSLAGRDHGGHFTAIAGDPATGGYWLAGSNGAVFSLDAPFYGSLSGRGLTAPVTGMAATRNGDGYWLVTAAGAVYTFGAAGFHGSASGDVAHTRIVAILPTPDGGGYWLVGQDGAVLTYGDATFAGSLGGRHPRSPVVAAAATPGGGGYWLVTASGAVFAFGDAGYLGGNLGMAARAPISAIAASPTGQGYWLADGAGEVFAFGDATRVSVPEVTRASAPEVAAAHPAGRAKPLTPVRNRLKATAQEEVTSNLTGYTGGDRGDDISEYQCGDIPGPPPGIAVVQVTGGGLDQPPNPCYRQEAEWAGRDLSGYIYMGGLPAHPVPAGMKGPAGHCRASMWACQSYNYGYNEVIGYVAYSSGLGVHPHLWWLDVERYSGWNSTASNSLVVQGALAALASLHVSSGVYSTTLQWQQITGGLAIPHESEWTPGAGNMVGGGYSATSFCADPGAFSFGGGHLELVQFGYSGPFPGSWTGPTTYDQDYACT